MSKSDLGGVLQTSNIHRLTCDAEDLIRENGLLKQLAKLLVEKTVDAELTEHVIECSALSLVTARAEGPMAAIPSAPQFGVQRRPAAIVGFC